MDIDALEAEIKLATDEALVLADALAAESAAGRGGTRTARQLGLNYQEKRRYIRRLRAALKVEVAG